MTKNKPDKKERMPTICLSFTYVCLPISAAIYSQFVTIFSNKKRCHMTMSKVFVISSAGQHIQDWQFYAARQSHIVLVIRHFGLCTYYLFQYDIHHALAGNNTYREFLFCTLAIGLNLLPTVKAGLLVLPIAVV